MGLKDPKRRKRRNRSLECLEDRRLMAADLPEPLIAESIAHHVVDPPIEHHSILANPPVMQHGGAIDDPPPLTHHARHPLGGDADFWLEPGTERDLDTLLGDIDQMLSSAHGLTGLTQVRNNYGFIGTGQTVAIIDSGIAYDHYALGGGLGSNYRVVGGWDFTEENDANPYDDGPEGSHGTHVAGIVGGNPAGTNDDGVAPGVDLVALRVFNDVGDGWFSWVENALRWVHQHRNDFDNPITAVNLSLGTAWNSTSVPSWSTMEDEFAQLEADGIFVSVSAGNDFADYNVPGLSYPAASPHVVPVMSVDDNGSLSHFSQRHPTAIAAPGRFIVSTVPDYIGNQNGVTDDFASFSGTSMAAPYVAGASVLLREAMQFVGYANITQDTIFNHMMATADTFFDAATGQNFKRLNLVSAFNALMPSDEYGSTSATAFNLGTLSGSSEISGLIGTLSDADYFRFTAASNGTVTFTASTTHGLAPQWTGAGGTVSGPNGQTFTFNVVAGQTYTLGLSTGGGIGYYELAIEAEAAFSFIDWGAITQALVNNIASAGETWYRVQASRTGFFTTEALFASAGGNIDISFYNNNLQWLTGGIATATGERIDVQVTAGTDYFVRVVGTNANVDFRLTNLVTRSGNTVSVAGTTAADTFTFAVGTPHHTITVNGAGYQFSSAAVTTFNFAGGGGHDNITLTGSDGDETATLNVGDATFSGAGFSASAAAFENVIVHAGGGNDLARLYDSAGDDTFTTWWNRAIMSGTGYWNDVRGFDRVFGYSSSGNDQAWLRDTAGDDVFTSWWDRGLMYGNGYWNDARGFDRVYAFSNGGNDQAWLRDSAGDDIFTSWWDRALMYGSGYWNDARGFDQVYAFASSGNDQAFLRDSSGDDLCTAWSDRVVMAGAVFSIDARSFDRAQAFASLGNDLAEFYDSAGDDVYSAGPDWATMVGTGYTNEARGFDRTVAYATTGFDRAFFYDSAGDDIYTSWWNRAILIGSGYWNEARGFDRTNGYSTAGNDRAVLRDSAALDHVHASGSIAYISGANYRNEVEGFGRVDAYDLDGDSSDTAFVDAVDYIFRLLGNWTQV
jgi:subtilisin family serine protease